MESTREGKQVHGHVLKLGLDSNAFVHTSLINMYAQNGELGNARLVFDESPLRDAVSYTALITGYVSIGCIENARELFDETPIRDVLVLNRVLFSWGSGLGLGLTNMDLAAFDLFESLECDFMEYDDWWLYTYELLERTLRPFSAHATIKYGAE
ncbi:hypothetical protein REPUB_Repub03eG0093200 [Reevesia pubescens]